LHAEDDGGRVDLDAAFTMSSTRSLCSTRNFEDDDSEEAPPRAVDFMSEIFACR
jgi:hypothetical protein